MSLDDIKGDFADRVRPLDTAGCCLFNESQIFSINFHQTDQIVLSNDRISQFFQFFREHTVKRWKNLIVCIILTTTCEEVKCHRLHDPSVAWSDVDA
jgi:hypothetical protein